MKNLDIFILNFIKKVGRRIKTYLFLNCLLEGLIASLLLACIVTITSIFIPLYTWEFLSFSIISSGIFAAFIVFFIKSPSKNQIALIADSKGLKERTITALEFLGKDDELSILIKEDAKKHIESYNIRKKFPFKFKGKQIITLIALIGVFFTSFYMPSASKVKAREIAEFKKVQKAEMKKVEKVKEKVESLKKLVKEDKVKLKTELDKALNELKEAENEEEIEKVLEKLSKKFEKKSNEIALDEHKKDLEDLRKEIFPKGKEDIGEKSREVLKELKRALSKEELTKELSKALESLNKEEIEKALSNLKEMLNNITEADRERLSNLLNALSQNLSEEQLKAILEKASEMVLDGNLNEEGLKMALENLLDNGEISLSSNSNNQEDSSNSQRENSQAQGNTEGQEGSEGEIGSSQGSQGNGVGQGSGAGQGNGLGYNFGSKEGLQRELSENQNSNQEVVVVNREIGNDNNLKGNANKSGQSQKASIEEGPTVKGQVVDYSTVVGEYTEKAYESIEKSTLPEGMKDIIKSYFEGIRVREK